MINQKELIDLAIGDKITLYLLVSKFEIKTSQKRSAYLNLELRDKSAIMPAKVWEQVDAVKDSIKEGTIVKIAGKIEEFNGALQIKIDQIRPAQKNDNVQPEDFLPRSKRPLNVMLNELDEVVNSIQNKYLNKIIKSILTGEHLERFSRAPAGKAWHHAYIHGLLEHTLEIVKACDLMCAFHSDINRDLLISGALLHDFGKIDELNFNTAFDYSDKGKLIGHIMIGALEVEKAASAIPNFPEELKNQLVHLILSHQGKLEFASPVEPKTLEAIVLYQADELSAKTNAYKYAIETDKNKSGSWTRFLPLANTSLYIPREQIDPPSGN